MSAHAFILLFAVMYTWVCVHDLIQLATRGAFPWAREPITVRQFRTVLIVQAMLAGWAIGLLANGS